MTLSGQKLLATNMGCQFTINTEADPGEDPWGRGECIAPWWGH